MKNEPIAWYIDNNGFFSQSNVDEFIGVIRAMEENGQDKDTPTFQTYFQGAKNVGSKVTWARDGGLVEKTNTLGDTTKLYDKGYVDFSDFILETTIKRNTTKLATENLKPFVIICKVFNYMRELGLPYADQYITIQECFNYYSLIDSYEELTVEYVARVVSKRNETREPSFQNTFKNAVYLSSIFSNLATTPFFRYGEQKSIIFYNPKFFAFINFIAVNGERLSIAPAKAGSETQNALYYNYMTDINVGLFEIIPELPLTDEIPSKVVDVIYKYIFGIAKYRDFDYSRFFTEDCYGIYWPFLAIDRLVAVKIYLRNKKIGEMFLDYIIGFATYKKDYEENRIMIEMPFSVNEHNSIEELVEDVPRGICERGPRNNKEHPMNLILYGAPGTGKTYATAEYAMAIIEHRAVSLAQKTAVERMQLMNQYNKLIKEERIVFTTFHQSYGYEDFIQGLRPDTESEKMSFKTVDGVFKRIADRAMIDKENDYVIIIDEINRANISKVFGELITLIEEDKRWGELNAISITLPSGEAFAVPNNLYIVGTMNSADKSISLIDTALRRRFEFVEVTPDYRVVEDEGLRAILEKLNKGLADELDSTDLLIGHAYFIGKTMDNLCEIMNRSIIPLLYEYFYDNAKKVKDLVKKAVDGYNYDIQDGKIGRIKLVKKD